MNYTFRPLHDYVVLRPLSRAGFSPSGLIAIPEKLQPVNFRAEVLAVGPGAKHPKSGKRCARYEVVIREKGEEAKKTETRFANMPAVEIGSIVAVPKFHGTSIRLSGEELVIIRANEILGVVQ